MHVDEVKQYVGHNVSITFLGRRNEVITKSTRVLDISYEALYGSYIVGDEEDFMLDKIISINPIEEINPYI